MYERIQIAFLGWREEARCLLEAWSQETSPIAVLGIVTAPAGREAVPPDIPLPQVEGISRLEELGTVSCLVDLRPPGSPKPDSLPGGLSWVSPIGTQLMGALCRQGRELQRYRNIIDTATDAVVTIGESHRIVFFNRAAEAMFGFKKEEVIGEDLKILIPSPHKEVHRDYVRRYVETRASRFIDHTVELTAERRSGEKFPISISFSVTEEAGHLLMTAVIRDVSQLQALQQRAIQNERLASMGQALSFVTHEIKNPLVSIGGFARHLLQSDSMKKEDLNRMEIIVREVRRLEELLLEIQDFSKPLILDKQEVLLSSLLKETMAFFRGSDETAGMTFLLDVKKDPVVWADPDRLRQVILNLIKNAMEAIEVG
jgi:PAS domain S-box-containing protein